MSTRLQQLVEALGARLERAVALDDASMRLIVYSPHYGAVDRVRQESILQRVANPDAVKWALSHGIASTVEPVRIPANEELGMLPRVCIPVRCQGLLLGYLYLIDSEGDLSDEAIETAARTAEAAGAALYQDQLLAELERSRERELLRDLFSDGTTPAREAAAELIDAGLIVSSGPFVALVLRPLDAEAGEALRVGLVAAFDELRRSLPARHAVSLARSDHGVVVVRLKGKDVGSAEALSAFGATLHGMAVHALGETRVLVGIGDQFDDLAGAAGSYRQALRSTEVAGIVPSLGDVVRWKGLGVYRLLCQLPQKELAEDALPEGLVRLLETGGSEQLVTTLEAYLDRAGDAKATAAALFLHRTSLYYRLSKVEDIAGIDLGDGNDRLSMHLGLKIARLLGLTQ